LHFYFRILYAFVTKKLADRWSGLFSKQTQYPCFKLCLTFWDVPALLLLVRYIGVESTNIF
jgi:hypothetical protein